jgi:hypothetical protein
LPVYVVIFMGFACEYCMYAFTVISTLICVLAEYVVCLCLYLYAYDNCYFYEVAWDLLVVVGDVTNASRLLLPFDSFVRGHFPKNTSHY